MFSFIRARFTIFSQQGVAELQILHCRPISALIVWQFEGTRDSLRRQKVSGGDKRVPIFFLDVEAHSESDSPEVRKKRDVVGEVPFPGMSCAASRFMNWSPMCPQTQTAFLRVPPCAQRSSKPHAPISPWILDTPKEGGRAKHGLVCHSVLCVDC